MLHLRQMRLLPWYVAMMFTSHPVRPVMTAT